MSFEKQKLQKILTMISLSHNILYVFSISESVQTQQVSTIFVSLVIPLSEDGGARLRASQSGAAQRGEGCDRSFGERRGATLTQRFCFAEFNRPESKHYKL